jgi:metal-responsive CopG/Arc/MetJ family transcriptional regulator
MALPGVVGTAIGLYEGERCIKVLVVDSGSGTIKRIPDHLEGYRVVVEVTGTIRPR